MKALGVAQPAVAAGLPHTGCYSRQYRPCMLRADLLQRRDELVLEYLPLVKVVAAHCRVRLPAHLEFSDLVQAGIVGLLDAASKYNTDTEASFSSYATYRIRGAILDSLRKQDPAARRMRKR